MTYIIGRGRYAREAYPVAPRAGAVPPPSPSCFVQVGWDQPPKSILVPAAGPGTAFPRDAGLPPAPLQVFIPAVTRGNQIEVYWSATLGNPGGDGNVSDAQFSANVAVSFTPAPSFPVDFFSVGSAQGGTRIPPPVGPNQLDSTWESMTGSTSFTVPAGPGTTVPLTVWLLYTSSHDVIVGGVNLAGFIPGVGAVLKATEYLAGCVAQPAPSQLFPFGEGG